MKDVMISIKIKLSALFLSTMEQVTSFFKKLFDSSDWPPRWDCGQWTTFHGWLYIISDLLIWSAYFTIPLVILRYIFKKQGIKFIKLYFLFAAFILACGTTHFLDAAAFWVPFYRLNALFIFITGVLSWVTVYYLIKYLPLIFSLKPQKELEVEIEQRKNAEAALNILNSELEQRVKEKTEEISRSEKRFRAMIENNIDFINVTDESYKISYLSPAAYRITGWTNDEIINGPLYLHIHPADKKKTGNLIKETLANPGKSINSLIRTLHKDGHYLWLEGVVTNMLNDENVKGLVFNYHDVTERMKEHEKLLASEARYRRLFEAAKDGILILNSDSGIIEDVNPFLITMLGYSHEEFLGKELWEIGLFKDIIENKTAFQELKKIGYSRYDNLPLQTKNKLTVWVEFVSNVYDVNGTQVVQCNIRDIAERKKAEEQLKTSLDEKKGQAERMSTILNTLPADIALLDERGFIIDVNEGWKKFTGINCFNGRDIGDDYLKNVEEVFGEDENDCKTAATGIKNVLENKTKGFVCEYAHSSSGVKKWFRMVVTPMQEQQQAGAVVMHIDISELKRLGQERLEAKIQEQVNITGAILNAQENERNFIAQELHDNVNQILAGTNLILSIAKNYPDKSREHVQSAMDNILEAIEENRKIAHTLISPDFETIWLAEQIHLLATGMLKKAGIDIYIKTSKLKEDLLGDELKLSIYRIAQEQCTNIIKYAGATLVNIFLETNGGIFNMVIADNGKGMEIDKKQTGIGLKNIHARLHMFNGDSSIVSSPGKGFSLEIRIPLLPAKQKKI
jgi:PAS domain S-box-containing protein